MKTIPFNIDKAKAGAKVVTRDGRPVRILTYDLRNGFLPIVAAVMEGYGESITCYPINGSLYEPRRCPLDLMLVAPDRYSVHPRGDDDDQFVVCDSVRNHYYVCYCDDEDDAKEIAELLNKKDNGI